MTITSIVYIISVEKQKTKISKNIMTSSVSAPNRLEGTKEEVGGLVTMKKNKKKETEDIGDDGFAKPKLTSSMLGLQELARKRRQEKENTKEMKKIKKKKRHDSSSSSNSEDSGDDDERSHKQDKHYRSYRPETPSNPGGVSHSAREKIKQRGERDRDKGLYAESRSRKHESSNGRDRDRPSRRHGDNDDSRDSERRERKSERKHGRAESSKRYADWEETPSSRYSEDDRKTTPRIRYNGMHCVQLAFSRVFWKNDICSESK